MWMKWIILFCFSFSVWGYRITSDFQNGFYWSTLPIKFTVLENDPSRKAKLESLARTAINEWESSTGLALWDFLSSGTNNIIRWSTNFAAETRMDPNSVLAVAIRYTNGPYFARTEIVINGNHALNQNDTYLRTTITHELGHTMGLDHSEVPEAIMAPTLQMWYSGLNMDDLNGMQDVYSQTNQRQITRYVSPLAYSSEKSQAQPLSCGTVGPATQVSSGLNFNAFISMAGGILISFVRKLLRRFKGQR